MRVRRVAASVVALGLLRGVAACGDLLEATNNDTPGVAATLATPAGIQSVVASLYLTVWITNNGSSGAGSPFAIYPSLMNMAFESYAQQAVPMQTRNALPRVAISNARGNAASLENLRDFAGLSKNSRTAANAVIALDVLLAGGQTLGSAGLDARARAFAFFANAVSLGNLALAYDSAAIVVPSVPSDEIPPLSAASDVMKAALASLDTAIAITGSPSAAAGFPMPATWVNGRAFSTGDFVRFMRSYRARFRAEIVRTPAERAAVDWVAVIADVNAGIVADVNVLLDPATSWTNMWLAWHFLATYHQMTPMILGMADTSGGYDAWLATPLANRKPFLIKTPDRRLPAGETRDDQVANSPAPLPPLVYFRNRTPTADLPDKSWGSSFYDFYRWQPINLAGGRGDFPLITKAEMDMLAAEGYLRTGQIAAAATLIDKYRTRAGLPALAGVVASATTPVPGGRACVPRVPTSAGTSTTCGTIFEAMKWEKRLETAFTGWASWYFDSRGWGDLAEGTPLEYPVPYQELDARQKPIYDLGGVGGKSAAPKGTYGY